MMKNILIFTKEYQHSLLNDCGGTGIFYKILSENLSQRGYNVIVFTINSKPFDIEENGIRIVAITNYFKFNFFQKLKRSICKRLGFSKIEQEIHEKEHLYIVEKLQNFIYINGLEIDIIETHDWEGVSLFFSELKIPYIIRCHGCWTILEKYFNYDTSNKIKITEAKAFAKSQNNIFISNYNQSIYTDTFNISGTLIKNGIDVHYFSPSKEKTIEQSIFFFGNATPEKGFDICLNTFYNILKKYPNATLHIIGRYNKKINHPNIIYHGFLTGEKLKATLDKGKIFLFPSIGETFGLSICEVMAMEKVVIASDIPSFNDFITSGENGFIARCNSDYYKYIELLFNDYNLQHEIGVKARKRIVKNYDLNHTINKTIVYYKSIIK